MKNGRKDEGRGYPFWVALIVFGLDRLSKELAAGLPAEGVTLIPGIIGLRYAENRGMAFSWLSGHPGLLAAASAGIILLAVWLLRKRTPAPLEATGLMLMLGGAVGNLVDRALRGYVPDMIELRFMRFAIFNVADVALTVGCALVILSLLRPERSRRGKETEE